MKLILLLSLTVAAAMARPEIPRFGPPSQRQQLPQQYGPPQNFPPPPPGPPQNLPPPGRPHSAYGPPAPPPIVTKNVYVHLPPDDPEDFRPPQVLPVTPPKKHYKLIFIKAPEPPRYVPPVLPQQQPDEHKTLVYVLVKKPEDQQQVQLPQAIPTEPSKPEVYFIKYKAQQEAQAPYPPAGPPSGPPAPPPPPPPPPPSSYGAPAPDPDIGFGPSY